MFSDSYLAFWSGWDELQFKYHSKNMSTKNHRKTRKITKKKIYIYQSVGFYNLSFRIKIKSVRAEVFLYFCFQYSRRFLWFSYRNIYTKPVLIELLKTLSLFYILLLLTGWFCDAMRCFELQTISFHELLYHLFKVWMFLLRSQRSHMKTPHTTQSPCTS